MRILYCDAVGGGGGRYGGLPKAGLPSHMKQTTTSIPKYLLPGFGAQFSWTNDWMCPRSFCACALWEMQVGKNFRKN